VTHTRALLQALFVTFLWSTSWILIKIGLPSIPALPFAGLRYGLAFLCLLPLALRSGTRAELRGLSRRDWGQLALLGLILYAITQGTQFLGLFYLPAITVSLLLSCSPIIVALLSAFWLQERPSGQQWGGMAFYLMGVLVYFFPTTLPAGEIMGLVIVGIGVCANALSSLYGRSINRDSNLSPRAVTLVSMGIGALILLITGVATQGIPQLTWQSWAIVLWLAVVNTAFAFTLWNHTLRTLTAIESSLINNTMLIQIALLAWIFLGDRPTGQQVLGLVVASVGILLVQLQRRRAVTVTSQQEGLFIEEEEAS
jgi:drug/metabolite transporter (DMT)-like permease